MDLKSFVNEFGSTEKPIFVLSFQSGDAKVLSSILKIIKDNSEELVKDVELRNGAKRTKEFAEFAEGKNSMEIISSTGQLEIGTQIAAYGNGEKQLLIFSEAVPEEEKLIGQRMADFVNRGK